MILLKNHTMVNTDGSEHLLGSLFGYKNKHKSLK